MDDGPLDSRRPLMSVNDVAAMLSVNKFLVYRALVEGRLRGFKVGGRPKAPWRIRIEDVEAWLYRPEPRQASDPTAAIHELARRRGDGQVHEPDQPLARVAEVEDQLAHRAHDDLFKVDSRVGGHGGSLGLNK